MPLQPSQLRFSIAQHQYPARFMAKRKFAQITFTPVKQRKLKNVTTRNEPGKLVLKTALPIRRAGSIFSAGSNGTECAARFAKEYLHAPRLDP
jgi:hypothetical protein